MKCFFTSLLIVFFLFQNRLKAQVFIGPYYAYGVNYINGFSDLSPTSTRNMDILSIGANLEFAWNHPLYFKSFIQYSDGLDDVTVIVNQTQKNVSYEQGVETAFLLSYRYMNTSLDFGPGYNYQNVVLTEYNTTEPNYIQGNANLITANAQASMYFSYGLSGHLRLSHRLNSLSWYSEPEIRTFMNQYLLVEMRIALNIPIKKLKWKPKIRPFKVKNNKGNCPDITI